MESNDPLEVRILGCSGGAAPGQAPTSLLVGPEVALDAGSLASRLSLAEQSRLRHVLLSHAHLDHIRELALLLDNRMAAGAPVLRVHALAPVLRALREHYFNGVLWFDPSTLSDPPIELVTVREGEPFRLAASSDDPKNGEGGGLGGGELEVTPLASHHGVPATGYAFARRRPGTDPGGVFAALTDTGYEPAVFEQVAELPRLELAMIEASFPDAAEALARATHHLTPSGLARGAGRVLAARPGAKILATHLKPRYRERIVSELKALGLPLQILEDGERFSIG